MHDIELSVGRGQQREKETVAKSLNRVFYSK